MSNVVNLHGNPHEQTHALLPWYVNGTLDAAENAMVVAHLAECAECQAELEIERGMSRKVAGLSMDVEQGWAAMRRMIETTPEAPADAEPIRDKGRVVPFLRRPVATGWAIAGQLAAAGLVLVAMFSLRQPAPGADYHALGSPEISQPGNLVVLFRPETSERDLRATLERAQARIVSGPMASGAWMLRVDAARRDAAVAALRASPRIVLAEPVDASGTP